MNWRRNFFWLFWISWVSHKIQEKPIDGKKPTLYQNFTKTEKNGVFEKVSFLLQVMASYLILALIFKNVCAGRKSWFFGASVLRNNRFGWKEILCFERFCLKVPKKPKVIFCCWENVSLFGNFHVAVSLGKCIEVENYRGKICNISKNLGIKLAN